jgi:hypothetical protein
MLGRCLCLSDVLVEFLLDQVAQAGGPSGLVPRLAQLMDSAPDEGCCCLRDALQVGGVWCAAGVGELCWWVHRVCVRRCRRGECCRWGNVLGGSRAVGV